MNVYSNALTVIYNTFIATRIKLMEAGLPAETIQEFYLRSEIFLDNGKSSYDLILGKEAGKTASKTERLLQNNDAFAPVGWGLFVTKEKFADGISYPGNGKLMNYVDDRIFDGAAVGGFSEAECVQGVYNADMALYADGQEIIYKLDTSMLERVPDNSFQAGNRYHNSNASLADFSNFHPIMKQLVLIGGNENRINLTIQGANTGTIEAGSTANDSGKIEQNKAVVIMPGWIIRGGADKVLNIDLKQ